MAAIIGASSEDGAPSGAGRVLLCLSQTPHALVSYRDENLKLVWCNEAYGRRFGGGGTGSLRGTTLHDLLPRACAEERSRAMAECMRRGTSASTVQMLDGERMEERLWPLDVGELGPAGVMAALVPSSRPSGVPVDVLFGTATLGPIEALTASELRVAYFVAQGSSDKQIAGTLHRSVNTVETHVSSMLRKLSLPNRASLVKMAVERGITAFTVEEWNRVIDGVVRVGRG